MSTTTLPVPAGDLLIEDSASYWGRSHCAGYTADQLRAYGAECVAAERERCSAYCDGEGLYQTARSIRAGEPFEVTWPGRPHRSEDMAEEVMAVSAQVDRGVRPHALPHKRPAVFHHPTMDMPLYDGLAMDLHAMTYAEPLFAEIARLKAALKKANDQAEEFERGWYLRGDALEVAVRQNEHDMLMTGEELRACRAALSGLGPNVRAKRETPHDQA